MPSGIDSDNKGSMSKKLNEHSMNKTTHDILNEPVAADREQLSNLNTTRPTAGTQPDWETGSTHGDDSSATIRERAEHAAERTRQLASRAGQSVQHSYESGRRQINQQARRAKSRLSDALDENPLALVAVGIGVGAALGLLLPSTRRENQLMGPQRDRLKRQLMDTGAEQLRHAREQLDDVQKNASSQADSSTSKKSENQSESASKA